MYFFQTFSAFCFLNLEKLAEIQQFTVALFLHVMSLWINDILFYVVVRLWMHSASPSRDMGRLPRVDGDDTSGVHLYFVCYEISFQWAQGVSLQFNFVIFAFSHVEFEKDGVKCMRMKFYAQGSRRRGTVHLEVQKVV